MAAIKRRAIDHCAYMAPYGSAIASFRAHFMTEVGGRINSRVSSQPRFFYFAMSCDPVGHRNMSAVDWSEISGINTLHTHTEIRHRAIITSNPDISISSSFAPGSAFASVEPESDSFLSALCARQDVITKTQRLVILRCFRRMLNQTSKAERRRRTIQL